MYGITTKESVPAIFLTDRDAWDGYMGHIWYNILQFIGLSQSTNVVEVSPGFSTKLGIALKKIGFRGNLYLLDPSTEALESISAHYSHFMPDAKIIPIAHPIETAVNYLPKMPLWVLSNHPFDDMLLRACANKTQTNPKAFQWSRPYSSDPTNSLRNLWEKVSEDKPLLHTAELHVQEAWQNFLDTIAPIGVVMNQYPSSTLHDSGLGNLNDYAGNVFLEFKKNYAMRNIPQNHIQKVLNANKNYNHPHMGKGVLNAKYWLVAA